jgi:molybdopterin-guanine dinucleotide biosynthesis protein A
VWCLSALVGVRTLFAQGERALHTAIEHLASTEVEVPVEALLNINTPDDLDRYP